MSSLVSASEKSIISGLYDDTFQTFQRDIVVYKEPIKNAIISRGDNNPSLFGFGDAQVQTQYTYTPVSGIFPAIIRYASPKNVGKAEVMMDTNAFIPIGEVKIKVKPDCYNFIESGTTDKITFDNRDFYFVGKAQASPFLGNLFYVYQLKPKI
jgi:hypothetical protein